MFLRTRPCRLSSREGNVKIRAGSHGKFLDNAGGEILKSTPVADATRGLIVGASVSGKLYLSYIAVYQTLDGVNPSCLPID